MEKMKKNKIISAILIGALLIISSCATKSTETVTDETTVAPAETEPAKPAKKEEKKPEPKPEDPPNIKFAKMLQERLNANDTEGAIALFEKIPEELKDDIDLKLLLGALYYSNSQFQNSITVAEEVLSVDNANMDALELISMCNHAMGDKKSYQETSKRILEVDPYNSSANIQRAQDFVLAKKYKQARDSYRKALKNDPNNQDALLGYAQTSYYIDDTKTARATLEKILDDDPENPQANAYMGKLSAEEENYYKAAKYVETAIQNDPYNYDYYLDYGNYLRYQGKYDDATTAWTKATQLDPTYFLAYAYLAGIYDERNMFSQALENYHMVIETNPKYYYAYEETAILEYHLGNYENAINYFSKAFEYFDSYAYKLMCFASYYKMGEKLKAKEFLTPYLKKMDKETAEYQLVRFFCDNYSKNAETSLIQKINKEDNSTKRGKMLFYMGLYYELMGADVLANEYYGKVIAMQAPMFFEYRIAEWGLGS